MVTAPGWSSALDAKPETLARLVAKQLDSLFFYDDSVEKEPIENGILEALPKVRHCFSKINNKYFLREGKPCFNPFHSGQYAIFLYFLSRCIYDIYGENQVSDKIYYLNKALNALDIYYQVELPSVFYFEHPVGSVIGRATFSDYLTCYQNCSIGGNKGYYPSLGKRVTLFSGASVLGKSRIGDNCIIAAGALVKDANIPDNSIVFGSSPHLIIKRKDPSYFTGFSVFIQSA